MCHCQCSPLLCEYFNMHESTKFGIGQIVHMYTLQALIQNDGVRDLAVCSTMFCTPCLHWLVCLGEKS